jgi:hypothetical protein
MRASCASGRPLRTSLRQSGYWFVSQTHRTVRSTSFSIFLPPVQPSISCIDMTELDFEFQTVCHRTIQTEKRIARQLELATLLTEKGQPTADVQASLSAMHATLGDLRAKRSDMARKLRYQARKTYPR